MSQRHQPYLRIEEDYESASRAFGIGVRLFDVGVLHYKGKSLDLNATEYGILKSLLDVGGFDLKNAAEERKKLRRRLGTTELHDVLNKKTVGALLSALRDKIEDKWGDELVLPRAIGKDYKGLRLWTRAQIKRLERRMAKPGPGVVSLQDERLRWHLYIDGREATSPGSEGVSPLFCLIAKRAAKRGFFPNEDDFHVARIELTGHDKMSLTSLPSQLKQLRRILETAGKTLTYGVKGTRAQFQVYRMIDHKPGQPIPTSAQLAAPFSGVG